MVKTGMEENKTDNVSLLVATVWMLTVIVAVPVRTTQTCCMLGSNVHPLPNFTQSDIGGSVKIRGVVFYC